MRKSTVVLFTLLTGCASGGAVQGSDAVMQPQTVFQSDQGGTMMKEGARAERTQIDSPPTVVWTAVKKIYADLDIPIVVDNAAGHQLGNMQFVKSRQLGGRPMQDLINCGDSMTGPKAATFRITMSLMTDVNPDGKGGTLLQTTFVASGRDVSGTSSFLIPCATTGQLEALVLGRVKEAVGKP